MKIVYKPEDQDEPFEFEFVAPRIKASAAEIIESRAGIPIREIPGALFQGNTRVTRAVLWYLMSLRAKGGLKWETFDYALSEVTVSPGRHERQQIREALESGQVPESAVSLEMQIAALEEMERLDAAEGETTVESDEAGKAPSLSD